MLQCLQLISKICIFDYFQREGLNTITQNMVTLLLVLVKKLNFQIKMSFCKDMDDKQMKQLGSF